jgi:hypothetical protein
MIYDLTAGNDLVTILGGGGYNTLTIWKNAQNFTLRDYQGMVLFQTGSGGSIITLANLQHITALGDDGKPIYTFASAPPPVPDLPPDKDFDHVTVFPKADGDAEQIKFGTPEKDKIVQYGATGNVTQYAEGAAGNDWLLQVGGDKNSDQTAVAGDGNDTIYQYGGKGDSNQYISGGSGNQTLIQIGGQGTNVMNIHVGGGISGKATVQQYGGSGNNTMEATGGADGDVIEMYGGNRNNTMIYYLTAGNDVVTVMGGGGYNTLTIYKNLQNFTLRDYQGRVLFQTGVGGSIITVANLQRITVIGDAGKPIYTYNAGIVPAAIAPLLLLLGN